MYGQYDYSQGQQAYGQQQQSSSQQPSFCQGYQQGFGNGFQGQSFEQQSSMDYSRPKETGVSASINKAIKAFQMPGGLMKAFKLTNTDIAIYFGGFFTMAGLFYFCNTWDRGDAGQIVPIAAIVQLMGFVMAYLRAVTSGSVAGIAPETLHIWLAGILCRLSVNCIKFWSDHADSYLPEDGMADFAYQWLEIASAIVIGLLLHEIHVMHKHPIQKCEMSVNVIFGCVVLSIFIHPKLNDCWSNLRFAAGQYLEGVAMLPQVLLMAKEGGKVEALTSHYIACSFVAQTMMCGWWLSVQDIYHTDEYPSLIPGQVIALFSICSVLLLADFMYKYVKAIAAKASLFIPGGFDV